MLSGRRIKCLRAQGYFTQSDAEISELAFGHRFALALCGIGMIVGVSLASIPVLAVMATVAFLSVVLPRHPFDYLYNHVVRKPLGKVELPRRSAQLKFACGIGGTWLSTIIYFFHIGEMTTGYVLGVIMICVSATVTLADFCVAAPIYNFLFKVKTPK